MENNFAIGFDIGGTTITAGLVDGKKLNGEIVQIDTPASLDGFVININLLIEQIKSKSFVDCQKISFAIPGRINSAAKQVIFSPNLTYLNGVKFGELFPDFEISVFNDVDAALAGEIVENDYQAENVLLFNIGTGLGSAFYFNGHGSWQIDGAGEIGHTKIIPNGRLCTCGANGCIEAYFSGTAFLKEAKEKISPEITRAKELFDLAKEGNSEALTIITDNAFLFGLIISNCVNILGTERVVLGGQISRDFDVMIGTIKETFNKNIFGSRKDNFIIEPSKLIGKSAVLGSAFLAQKIC